MCLFSNRKHKSINYVHLPSNRLELHVSKQAWRRQCKDTNSKGMKKNTNEMLHSAHCSFANQPICIALQNSTLGFFHPSNFQSYIIFRFLNQLNRTYENACKFGAKQITSFIKSRTHSQFNFYFFFWSLHLVLMKWISWIRFVSMVFAFLRFFFIKL